LAEDLHRFLEGKPIRARRVGTGERVVKWARRRPAAAALLAALLVMAGAAAATGVWLQQQETERRWAKSQREGQARAAIVTALKRADELRREERLREAVLVLTSESLHLADADAPELEQRLKQAQADIKFAYDLECVRESRPFRPDGSIDHRQRAADFQAAFARAGLRMSDDVESIAASIRTSPVRDEIVAALDEWAVAALMLSDGPTVERLLRIARAADPEPRWRDRFRDPAAWRSADRLRELADEAFTTSPPPPGHQIALVGLLLRQRGGGNRALQLLSEACRRRPGNFWLNLEMGAALRVEGRDGESAGYYHAALAVRPENAWAHWELGLVLLVVGQTEEALAEHRRAVELAPTNPLLRSRLVFALTRAGYWKDAATACRRALEIDPKNHFVPTQLATELWRNGRPEDAVVMFHKAIEIDPSFVSARHSLGVLFWQTGRHEEAVTALRAVTKLAPQDANARQLLAHELATTGHPAEAITEMQAAIASAPTTIEFYVDLGKLLRAQGRPEAAVAAFEKAVKLNPGQAWDGLAATRLDQGRFAEARFATDRLLDLYKTGMMYRALRRQRDLCDLLLAVEAKLPAMLAGQERPTDVPTQRALAEWCYKHKRLTAMAASYYTAVLAMQPSLADDLEAGHRFHAACAAALAGCGLGADAAQLDQRRAELRKQALAWLTAEYNAWAERHRLAKPGDRAVVTAAVRAWQSNQDLATVRDEKALAKFPLEEGSAWRALWSKVAVLAARDPVTLFTRARDHGGRREWAKAVACYAVAFELEPTDNGEYWFEYAGAQRLAGNQAGYRKACEHMLARGQSAPAMRPYLVARACTLAPGSAADPERPRQVSQGELQRSATAYWSLTEQAALDFRAGRFQAAIPLLERSLTADGRPGRAVLNWLWLALTYQKLGKAEESRRWLDRAANWLDQQGGQMPQETGFMGSHLHNWLEAHVLLQEAKALLR
jgi:tetratricopeptide (TPR) repeat protein